MAHEIETAAFNWAEGAPWHGLGAKLPEDATIEQMIDLAGIGWTVSLERMFRCQLNSDDFYEHQGAKFLTRDDTNTVLDIVGPDYRPIQNRDAMEFFRAFLDQGQMKLDAAGSLRGGRFVWGLAKMKQGYEVLKGDRNEGYLLCLKPHQQGEAMHILTTSVRVVCMNTTRAALGWSGQGPIPARADAYRVAHNTVWNEVRMADAREFLGLARDGIERLADVQRRLAVTPISKPKVFEILGPLYNPDATVESLIADFDANANRPLRRVLEAVHEGPGATPDTAWGVYNGVTFYHDHMSGRSQDVRMTSAWTGEGSRKKAMVLQSLHKYAME